jgi:hypothetical protein
VFVRVRLLLTKTQIILLLRAQGEAFKKHLPRVQDYLWVAEDGMKMQGMRFAASCCVATHC